MFVSSAVALDMLAAHAPRAWCKRLLEYLVFTEKLDMYALLGKISRRSYYIRKPPQSGMAELEITPDGIDDVVQEFNGGDLRLIHSDLAVHNLYIDWEAGELVADDLDGDEFDWIGEVYGEGHYHFRYGGLMLVLSQIEMIAPYGVAPSKDEVQHAVVAQPPKPTGRPRKHDWEGALIHVITVANTVDGLPVGAGAQAAIIRLMQEWFQANGGEEPAESDVKRYARRIMESLGRK